VSEKLTTRVLYEAAQARTAANCPASLPQTLAFSVRLSSCPCILPQERYNCSDSGSKKEIPGRVLPASHPLRSQTPEPRVVTYPDIDSIRRPL
jgi:hypothetical protein